ncbi:MAG: hypothetical protein NT069_30690 [Planctomycetota bacterium]|nr:hypothetical protein [Planctomycetota bacterium]
MHFTPKRDFFDGVQFYGGCLAIWLCLLAPGLLTVHLARINTSPSGSLEVQSQYGLGTLLIGLGVWLLIDALWDRMVEAYEITETEFVIRKGWRLRRVPIAEIQRVERIDVPRAAFPPKPGWRVEYTLAGRYHGHVDLAVRNEDAFLTALRESCPHIVFRPANAGRPE